jgi:putative transcriptional regulator
MLRVFLLACGAAATVWALAAGAPGGPHPAAVAALSSAERSLAGQFLVATDALRDPRFARTVVYLARHDASGALGLVINRPIRDLPLATLLRQFGLDDRGVTTRVRMYYGGPVETTSSLLVLHTAEYATAGTEPVADDVAVTPVSSRAAVLSDIARGAGPRRYLFALGYAGWAPGQLEREIDDGAWITVPADETLLFDDDFAHKWERAMARRRLTI